MANKLKTTCTGAHSHSIVDKNENGSNKTAHHDSWESSDELANKRLDRCDEYEIEHVAVLGYD